MGLWDQIEKGAAVVGKILGGFWDWVTDTETQKQAERLIQIIGIIIGGIGLISSQPIPNERRPMLARDILKWLKAIPEEQLAKIVLAKADGVLDEALDEEMDEACGMMIGRYMRDQDDRPARKGKAR